MSSFVLELLPPLAYPFIFSGIQVIWDTNYQKILLITFRIIYFKSSATWENSLQQSLCNSEVPSYYLDVELFNSFHSTYAQLLELLSFKYPVEQVIPLPSFKLFRLKTWPLKKLYPKQFIITEISNVQFKNQIVLFRPPFWYTEWPVSETKFHHWSHQPRLVSLLLRSSLKLSYSLQMLTGFEQHGFTMHLRIYLHQPGTYLATFSILKKVPQILTYVSHSTFPKNSSNQHCTLTNTYWYMLVAPPPSSVRAMVNKSRYWT